MKLIYKKHKDYECYGCKEQFNWNDKSVRYGKMECKSKTEMLEIDKKFCGIECYKDFENTLNQKNK